MLHRTIGVVTPAPEACMLHKEPWRSTARTQACRTMGVVDLAPGACVHSAEPIGEISYQRRQADFDAFIVAQLLFTREPLSIQVHRRWLRAVVGLPTADEPGNVLSAAPNPGRRRPRSAAHTPEAARSRGRRSIAKSLAWAPRLRTTPSPNPLERFTAIGAGLVIAEIRSAGTPRSVCSITAASASFTCHASRWLMPTGRARSDPTGSATSGRCSCPVPSLCSSASSWRQLPWCLEAKRETCFPFERRRCRGCVRRRLVKPFSRSWTASRFKLANRHGGLATLHR